MIILCVLLLHNTSAARDVYNDIHFVPDTSFSSLTYKQINFLKLIEIFEENK